MHHHEGHPPLKKKKKNQMQLRWLLNVYMLQCNDCVYKPVKQGVIFTAARCLQRDQIVCFHRVQFANLCY